MAAFDTPKKLSPELQKIVGEPGPLARPSVVSKLWAYIHKKKLQSDPSDKRVIVPDETFAAVFGPEPINMFSMNKKLSAHLS